MSRVLMLVINPMTHDTRVEKEAASLAAAGHDVTVVATAGDGLPPDEDRGGYRIIRIQYRRVVKERVLAPAVRLRAAAAGRARAASALEATGVPSRRGLGDVLWFIRRVITRVRVLAGGALLKTIRARILVPEYWGSIASTLPDRVERPDVIHAHDLGTLAAAGRLAEGWTVDGQRPRVVYDSHELYVEQQTSWTRREKLGWRLHEQRWIRRADAVITVSGGIARELQRRYRLPEEPTLVLNSPPDVPAPIASDVRTDAGLTADQRLAVYVGTVKPGRGVDRLVSALEHGSWHLAIVGGGSGPHVDDVVATAQGLGVSSRLHVLAGVPAAALSTYLATADVGAHAMEPTCRNHELALPNKLFDYLFAGLPVAVSNLEEMRGLVVEHDLGDVFDPADPAATAAAIETAAERGPAAAASPDLLAELGWGRQAERLLALYGRL